MADRVIHDREAALALLEQWLDHLAQRERALAGRPDFGTVDEIDEWFLTHITLLKRIGGSLHGDQWANGYLGPPWPTSRDAVLMMRGTLRTEEAAAAMFTPPGPRIAAASLHPWVWTAAREVWANGHHREAVANAATMVESNFRSKLGRFDISGASLARQAFSLSPASAAQPRLRLVDGPDAPEDQRWKSAHQGAMDFGAGVFEGIRNWAAHVVEDADEQVALEYLAALSVLARWVDGARSVTG
ncbi:MAG TPA: TIGR02391 family protein [Nocardioides sp.]|uniref:TIGR02391 family protein n=1 Tax=Nocardioides sp. TaxID=35761 RepID=UPI002ED9F38C